MSEVTDPYVEIESSVLCACCDATIWFDAAAKTTRVNPIDTGLTWIGNRSVPLVAIFSDVWPTRWTVRFMDYQLFLELLFLVRDPRLEMLTTHLKIHGQSWERFADETWKVTFVDPSVSVTGSDVALRNSFPKRLESFKASVEAICPSPPPIALVVAAAERHRTGDP